MKNNKLARLALVVPCYNEQEVLPSTNTTLQNVLNTLIGKDLISDDSYILYVNDGSKDETWNIIEKFHEESNLVDGIKLSRNKGHQNALMAGLMYAKDNCDCAISIDADLQDDVNVIEQMVNEYLGGSQIVYGVRNSRDTDSFFKRKTATMFYKLMEKLGAKTIYNHADFRLMSSRALQELASFNEVNLFLRGIVTELGFKTSIVKYDRLERQLGESKYPFSKMLSLAFEGITSFSIKPVMIVVYTGAVLLILGFLAILTVIIYSFFAFFNVAWFIVSIMSLFTGMNLLAIGLVGIYVGKNYMETKSRPRYIIETVLIHR
ncbi:MAG: glycosyltransferase family 2 protein [Bacilli bacterium]|nr:glycosyltransferase family 2 protein [Bacilli bacterium]